MPSAQRNALAVSALAIELGAGAAPSEIRLLPAGRFRAVDGRPGADLYWNMTDAGAQAILAANKARVSDRVIDYEHATLSAQQSDAKAPAAGWFRQLDWRPGDGLYATDVRWTAAAAEMIAAGEKRYLSPVFGWDRASGEVRSVLMAALVNNPGLDGLADLAALSSLMESDMDDLIQRLQWLLNLPVGSPPADVAAHLNKIVAQLKATPEGAAAGFDLAAYLTARETQIAALAAATPDPAQWAPVAALASLQTDLGTAQAELTALQSQMRLDKVNAVVTDALSAGKLTPALEVWARDLGTQNLESLAAYLEGVTPGLVPGTTQTGGAAPTDAQAALAAYRAPRGYAVDPRAMELHQSALAYQRDHTDTPYEAAVAAVSKS